MLGTRTKQVFAYGRRGHRIVNVSEDREGKLPVTASSKLELDVVSSVRSETMSPQPAPPRRKRAVIASPPSSPETEYMPSPAPPPKKARKKSPKSLKLAKAKAAAAFRQPLSTFPPNVPGSPAIPPKFTQHRLRKVIPSTLGSSPLKPKTPKRAPLIDVDIMVLDSDGRSLSHEKRVSRPSVQMSRLPALALGIKQVRRKAAVPAAKPAPSVIVLDESDEEAPLKKKAAKKAREIVLPSDESDGEVKIAKTTVSLKADAFPRPHPIKGLPLSPQVRDDPAVPTAFRRVSTHPTQVPVTVGKLVVTELPRKSAFLPWTPDKEKVQPFVLISSPHIKPRPLTPARYQNRRPSLFPAPPSPPTPTSATDVDLSFDFSQLNIGESALLEDEAAPQPEYLKPLLEECCQTTPHEFSAFIEMFPFDPIVQTADGMKAHFQKIGEASYSEVFGIGDVVLKVIPLRDETRADALPESDIDTPAPSDAKDVLKEIVVTHAMGDICDGFVKLLRTYIVRGKYPSLLLNLWDKYNEETGSESVRPDVFSLSQVYAIIVLPNGGPDLEAFTFPSPTKNGWRQACSLFWQVARTLADAENLVSFEHRDLHWGQILVKVTPTITKPGRRTAVPKVPMDDEDHGIEATVIDLGLARMNAEDGAGGAQWTPFDELIFEGEGDYQFDVYRMMRVHNGNSWEEYRPLTNVMWLHYLTLKLLKSKHLKPPWVTRKNAASAATFTERECYDCLVEMEEALKGVIAPCMPALPGRKGRRKTQAPVKVRQSIGPKSAGDVIKLAIGRGWVR